MLIRDALDPDGEPTVEVCMLRRNLRSEFVAGAYVFPGGSVDPDDRSPAAEALCRGRSDAEASAMLGMNSGGLAFWVAALRECFEEAGVMLARREDPGRPDRAVPLDTSDPETSARFTRYRDALNQQRIGLLDICREEQLQLAADTMYYVSHWITPEVSPKRYDTRFFITAAPPGQIARHDDGETIATIWVRADDALRRNLAGEIDLLPPTVTNLGAISSFRSTAEVMAWAAQVTRVPTVLPIVVLVDGQLVVLRPGDAGYEEAFSDRLIAGSEMPSDLSAAAVEAWGPKADTD
jgi:8-oxo-dGTP pyrophosphatase MutT (NUDIX family)